MGTVSSVEPGPWRRVLPAASGTADTFAAMVTAGTVDTGTAGTTGTAITGTIVTTGTSIPAGLGDWAPASR